MSKLLNQLNDEELDFTVRFKDTDGVYGEYEFLDIVLFRKEEYAVVAPLESDGYVDIFRIETDGNEEKYHRISDDEILSEVFEIFRKKNEDEFDFE